MPLSYSLAFAGETILLVAAFLNGVAADHSFDMEPITHEGFRHLQCRLTVDGSVVSDAVFFRNEDDNTIDPCLKRASYNSNISALKIDQSSECDGYYTCGKEVNGDMESSVPSPVYSEPTETGPGRQILNIEEGNNVSLPCHISKSPTNRHKTSWFKQTQDVEEALLTNHDSDESNYQLINAQLSNTGLYWCVVQTQKPGLKITNSKEEGSIEVLVRKKFIPARFIEDFSYSITEDGTAHFSTQAEENEDNKVHYEWRVNGTIVEPDSSSPEQLKVDDFPYGESRVEVVIQNTKYDGTNHSNSQVLNIVRQQQLVVTAQPIKKNCDKEAVTVNGLISGIAVLFALVLVLIVIICILLMICLKTREKRKCALCSGTQENLELNIMADDNAVCGSQKPSSPLVKVLKILTDHVTDIFAYDLPVTTDNMILKCLQDFVTLTNNNDIDLRTKTILEEIQGVLCSHYRCNNTDKNESARVEDNTTTVSSTNKGPIQTDGEKVKNTVEFDSSPTHTRPDREKDIYDSKLVQSYNQELAEKILRDIQDKLLNSR